jgi:predicted dehydrogenase
MTERIGIGVVGCGNVMDGAYMPLVERLRRTGKPIEVVSACHTSRERCQALLDKWNITDFTEDYRRLVARKNVSLVLVLTSMDEHAAAARAALEAGKHVLVEKPVATKLEEAEELVELARRSPGYLVCAPFVVLSPTFQAMASRLVRKEIGKICLARGRYGWSGPDWSPWFYRRGGGCIFDLAVYNLTSLTAFLGPAQRVTAMTGTAIQERVVKGRRVRVEAEDTAQILLDFGESLFGVVTSGFTMQKYRSPALELYGTEGTLQMIGDDWAPDGYELWRNQIGAWQVFEESDPHWSWADGLKHLIECIERKEPPLVTPEHAYHVLEVMLAAQASGGDGRTREIRSRFAPLDLSRFRGKETPPRQIHDRRRE